MEKQIPIYRTHFNILLFLVLLISCAVAGPVVKGTFYESTQENSPGVLLLHGWIGSGSNWGVLSSSLERQGYTVYALDLPQGNEYEMIKYVDEAYKFLIQKKIDPNRIALIGESTGANLALLYAANNKGIKTIVLLSPGFNFRLPVANPKYEIEKYGDRPILIIASELDPYPQSPRDSEQLSKWAKGKKELKWASSGHGIGMLNRDVLDYLISWLNGNLLGVSVKTISQLPSEAIPFPSSIILSPPDPKLPEEMKAFLGIWEGSWGGVLQSRLAIEKIDLKTVIVVYGYADHPQGIFKGGFFRETARVIPPRTIEWGGGNKAKFSFTMGKGFNTIEGTREFQGQIDRIIMRKKE